MCPHALSFCFDTAEYFKEAFDFGEAEVEEDD